MPALGSSALQLLAARAREIRLRLPSRRQPRTGCTASEPSQLPRGSYLSVISRAILPPRISRSSERFTVA